MNWLLILSSFIILGIASAFPSEIIKNEVKIPTKTLRPEGKIPIVGLGTWQATDEELESALEAALEAGYRHIDTAFVYGNEHVIGKVLKRWLTSGKVKREDLFIVSKLPPGGNRPAGVSKYLNKTLTDLQLDYLDMYLIHVPFAFEDVEGDAHPMKDGKALLDKSTDHVATWKAMEKQLEAGKTKAIGVSNFNQKQLQRILDNSKIKPANLQIELHAYFQQKPMVEFCKKNNIIVTAYSPLGAPGLGKFLKQFGQDKELPNILNNPVVKEIAKKHKKSEAQIVLRHGVQKDIVVIPKSTNKARLEQNLDIFNFELDKEDMEKLNSLDKGEKGRLIDFTAFPGVKEHPEYPF